jgi:hypothetical protein
MNSSYPLTIASHKHLFDIGTKIGSVVSAAGLLIYTLKKISTSIENGHHRYDAAMHFFTR